MRCVSDDVNSELIEIHIQSSVVYEVRNLLHTVLDGHIGGLAGLRSFENLKLPVAQSLVTGTVQSFIKNGSVQSPSQLSCEISSVPYSDPTERPARQRVLCRDTNLGRWTPGVGSLRGDSEAANPSTRVHCNTASV